MTLQQRRHLGQITLTVSGSGYLGAVSCDNVPHEYRVAVSSWTSAGGSTIGFEPGQAVASGSFTACGIRGWLYECDSGSDVEEIVITG